MAATIQTKWTWFEVRKSDCAFGFSYGLISRKEGKRLLLRCECRLIPNGYPPLITWIQFPIAYLYSYRAIKAHQDQNIILWSSKTSWNNNHCCLTVLDVILLLIFRIGFNYMLGKLDACSKWYIYTNMPQNSKANTVIPRHGIMIWKLVENVLRDIDKLKGKCVILK